MQALSDDLLEGADQIALELWGDDSPPRRRQVYRLAEAGEIPVIRKGKKIFSRRSALNEAFQIKPVAGEMQ